MANSSAAPDGDTEPATNGQGCGGKELATKRTLQKLIFLTVSLFQDNWLHRSSRLNSLFLTVTSIRPNLQQTTSPKAVAGALLMEALADAVRRDRAVPLCPGPLDNQPPMHLLEVTHPKNGHGGKGEELLH